MIIDYDKQIQLSVVDKHISLTTESAVEVVADNFGNICCHFTFDDQWAGVGKTARFIYNGAYKDVVLDADGDCFCPNEVVKKGRFYVGVYGGELKTSTPLAITVAESIISASNQQLPDDPTPGVYSQIMAIMDATIDAADEATTAATAATTAANNATSALNDAKEELENGGFITSMAEKNTGRHFGFWVGTQAQYDALENKPVDCLCLITDDTSYSSIFSAITQLNTTVGNIGTKLDTFNKVLWTGSIQPPDDIALPELRNYSLVGFEVTRYPLASSESDMVLLCYPYGASWGASQLNFRATHITKSTGAVMGVSVSIDASLSPDDELYVFNLAFSDGHTEENGYLKRIIGIM